MATLNVRELQVLIDDAARRQQARNSADAARKAQEADTQRQQQIERLRNLLIEDVGSDLFALLAVEVLPTKAGFVVRDELGYERFAVLLDSDISGGDGTRSLPERCWEMTAVDADAKPFERRRCIAADLRDALLLLIRDASMKFDALRAQAAADAQADARRMADDLADRQREAQDRQARIDAENRIDAESAATVKVLLAAHPLWVWPEGLTLIYYRLHWATGERGGEGYADYDSGFSLSDALDADGCITVYNYAGARRLKLNMQVHKPVWEIKTAARSAELPSDLVETASVVIVGIKERWSSDQRRNVWVRDADASSALLIGEQPVEAVRQALGCRSAQ